MWEVDTVLWDFLPQESPNGSCQVTLQPKTRGFDIFLAERVHKATRKASMPRCWLGTAEDAIHCSLIGERVSEGCSVRHVPFRLVY